MKIQTEDLELLMAYLEKELVDEVSIEVVNQNFAVYVSFKDAENRECEVILYDSLRKMKPDLTKKMQLQTRVKKEDT